MPDRGFRAVGRCQNNDAAHTFKSVHLGKQLIEGLLALVVAADLAVALFTDGVDLVDKNYTGGFFLGLCKKVSHLRRAHADEHLYKLRAGHGEKRHAGFACNGLGKHGFTCTRRAYKQYALGHRRADVGIFFRIMQIIDYFGEIFLRLILAGNIGKTYAVGGGNIDLGIALSHAERQRIRHRLPGTSSSSPYTVRGRQRSE